jgi:tRNA G46 methylase TrmB
VIDKIWNEFKDIGYDDHSVFIDIGSGFGKVVFQMAIRSKWKCYGIEIAKART